MQYLSYRKSSRRWAPAASALCLVGLATGQSNDLPRLGPLSSLASGISLDPVGRPSGATEETLVNPPTLGLPTASMPQPFNDALYAEGPDYSIGAIFGTLSEAVEINAMSLGNAQLPSLDSLGIPNVDDGQRWLATIVSVANSAMGAPGSGVARRRANTQGRTTPGADLFSYWASASHGLAPGLAGSTFIEQISEGFGFDGLSANQDIDALDLGMGVRSEARSPRTSLLFPNIAPFYFSLSRSCIDDVNIATNDMFAEDGSGVMVPANACTVYAVEWDDNNDVWLPRQVYRDAGELFLDPLVDDIDALELDRAKGITIFSTTLPATRSQLMVHGTVQNGNTTIIAPLMDSSGVFVTTKLGLRDPYDDVGPPTEAPDDVDGICIIDPEAGDRPVYFGVPRETIAVGQVNQIGLSLTRYRPFGSTVDQIVMHATGWADAPSDTAAYVSFFYTYNSASGTVPTWHLIDTVQRLPGEDLTVSIQDIPTGSTVAQPAVCAYLWRSGQILATSHVLEFTIPQ